MSVVLRRNRKGSDQEILRLNSLGLSLKAIGLRLNCHPTSVILRLKGLGIPAADTRRAFMEEVYSDLPEGSQDKIADMLEARAPMTIKDYVRELIVHDLDNRQHNQAA